MRSKHRPAAASATTPLGQVHRRPSRGPIGPVGTTRRRAGRPGPSGAAACAEHQNRKETDTSRVEGVSTRRDAASAPLLRRHDLGVALSDRHEVLLEVFHGLIEDFFRILQLPQHIIDVRLGDALESVKKIHLERRRRPRSGRGGQARGARREGLCRGDEERRSHRCRSHGCWTGAAALLGCERGPKASAGARCAAADEF